MKKIITFCLAVLPVLVYAQPAGVIVSENDCWILVPDKLDVVFETVEVSKGYYRETYIPPVIRTGTKTEVIRKGGLIAYNQCLPDGSLKKCYRKIPEEVQTFPVVEVVTEGYIKKQWIDGATAVIKKDVVIKGGWKNECR